MSLVSDRWARVRAAKGQVAPFLDLLAGLPGESDQVVLDEVVGRLSWLEHRGVADADRPSFQRFVAQAFAPAAQDLGWDPRTGERDERRLQRAAVLRALALGAREPAAGAEAQQRYRAHVDRPPGAGDPNLLDIVGRAAPRAGGASPFGELLRLAGSQGDPASP